MEPPKLNANPIETSCTSLNFLIATFIEDIQPLVLEKHEFYCGDEFYNKHFSYYSDYQESDVWNKTEKFSQEWLALKLISFDQVFDGRNHKVVKETENDWKWIFSQLTAHILH